MSVNIRCAGLSSAQVGRSLRDRRITGNPLPVRPNALDSRNRSRPNRGTATSSVLRSRSDAPYLRARQTATKIMRPSVSDADLC